MALYEVVPDSPLSIFAGPNTRSRSLSTAIHLAQDEAKHFGIPHTVEDTNTREVLHRVEVQP
jgi:hypothetical protein